MVKAEERIRTYRIPDVEMIQQSRVYLGLFNGDKQPFVDLDADFRDPFSDNWLAAIEAAANAAQDLTVKDELARLTEVVHAKMDQCRNHFQKMKYYIEKAFPEDKKLWDAFGYNAYESARNSDVKLIRFIKTLHNQAVKNNAKLIEAGYKQSDIDLVDELGKQLDAADQAQENYKKDRIFITQERIKTMNTAWEFVKKVNKASKIVFEGNYAKLKQYLLPGETQPEEKAPEETQTPAS